MAKVQLSHSAKEKFNTCGEMYRLHYIEKIRPTAHSAALVFGNALDVALNELLVPTGKVPEEVFEKEFSTSKIASKDCHIPTYTELVYPKSNFDSEILVFEDFETVYNYVENGSIKIGKPVTTSEEQLTIYKDLKNQGFKSLNEEEKKYYNLFNWLTMYRKGLMMLVAYRKHVLPMIEEVISSQENINLHNQDGDLIRGIVDLVAKVKGYGKVILDNKTSSMKYEDEAVSESEQLALYVHALYPKYNTNTAGFIVLNKQVKKNRTKICKVCGNDGSKGRAWKCDAIIEGKRCNGEWDETIDPEITVQFLIDTISEEAQDKVIESFDLTNEKIKCGKFEQNFNSCDNQYGNQCPYYNYCRGGSMSGLVKLKKDLDKSDKKE